MLLIPCLALAAMYIPRGPTFLVMTDPRAGEAAGMAVIAEAGGVFVSGRRYAWLSVAYSQEPGFARRLIRSGALAVLHLDSNPSCLVAERNG